MKVPRRLSGPAQRATPEDDPRGRSDGQQDGRLLPEALAGGVGPRVDHLERPVRSDLQAVLELPPGRGVVVRHRDLARGPGHVGADGEGGARVVFVVVAALWEMLQSPVNQRQCFRCPERRFVNLAKQDLGSWNGPGKTIKQEQVKI